MAVRIGANPIGWSNDDLRTLGGATPLHTCLSEARQAGFEGMELGHKFPREADALRAVLSEHGLDLVSGWYSCHLLERDVAAEMAALRPHLDLLKALGSTVLVLAECTGCVHGAQDQPISARRTISAAEWPELGRRLTALAEATLAEGVRVAYHYHMGTAIQTEDDVHALMAHTGPAFGLLLDTGHATFAGIDPVALATRYRERITHVHCKDVRPAVMAQALAEHWSFLDAVVAGVYTVPGDGCVNFPAVLAALPGYEGWLVVEAEQDPEKANPFVYATLGYANLARYAHAAGLR
jgi:inosose dehydratase